MAVEVIVTGGITVVQEVDGGHQVNVTMTSSNVDVLVNGSIPIPIPVEGPPGPPGSSDIILDEVLSGSINGVNLVFNTANDFEQISVYLNGLKLRAEHFSVTDTDEITIEDPPLAGDVLTADYVRTT